MSEILNEYESGSIKKAYKNKTYLKLVGLGVLVILFGIYVGDMLFGKSSLDVLLNLQDDKSNLEQSVKKLKKDNAVLQKKYFELKQLDPEGDEK